MKQNWLPETPRRQRAEARQDRPGSLTSIMDMNSVSRRKFLAWCGALPVLLDPAQQSAAGRRIVAADSSALPEAPGSDAAPAVSYTPHYRSPSPLSGILEKIDPRRDIYPSEIVAAEIDFIFQEWRQALLTFPANWKALAHSLARGFKSSPLSPATRAIRLRDAALQIIDVTFDLSPALGQDDFLNALARYFAGAKFLWAEFQITAIRSEASRPESASASTRVRFDLVDSAPEHHRRQHAGWMDLTWRRASQGNWRLSSLRLLNASRSQSVAPMFVDITMETLGGNASYHEQLARGADYWRTILDGASGIDIYGNFGVAAGDFDNDGWDDLYICQPSGLPNRLYRNRGDGSFEDVTDRAGVGVIDSSPSALFLDVDNNGLQDLIVVRGDGPLLFLNQGDGTFKLKQDAFRFAQNPQGTFTSAAAADYDGDGWLDVYFCVYSYYRGPDRYRYPLPYDNAKNGPPNFLFRNNRDGSFNDVTHETRLDQNNHRFSFACGWCDYDRDGRPDLYVANDFGEKNLYHNNGDGTFTDVAGQENVLDAGAGMSVCWFDYDNDGKQDLYVADMWSAAGRRITQMERFMPGAPENMLNLYRKHAMGNSLFRNEGHFQNATAASGTGMGRWAWSSDAWDFDHDGFPDIYIANGMISGPDPLELSSFFWRQVVARSPAGAIPDEEYERGWNAINELIRSDYTWSGYQRNLLYANNRDGTFSDISGAAGLDLVDDSRSFALADLDHDGCLEMILKNRTGPQLRIFHNAMPGLGRSLSFRLRGGKSNRDAIGASITIHAEGSAQTKFIQAGSGFLAQHTKELFFGVGHSTGPVRATIVWPSGQTEEFKEIPVDHRVEIEEGTGAFKIAPYRKWKPPDNQQEGRAIGAPGQGTDAHDREELPSEFETWLLAPIEPPDFVLPAFAGGTHRLSEYRGRPALLSFQVLASPVSVSALSKEARSYKLHGGKAPSMIVICADSETTVLPATTDADWPFPILRGNDDTLAVYNLLFRYTFDRRRDMRFPVSFLIDAAGLIVKIYQGRLNIDRVVDDARRIPQTPAGRLRAALPFPGHYYGGPFIRNYFTYGVTFAQHGYPDAAEAAFRRAIADEPQSADAYYDLGTLYMRQGKWEDARAQLLKAARLKPRDVMTINNLGIVAAREGHDADAGDYFTQALGLEPNDVRTLGNLADLRRAQGRAADAERLLAEALKRQPDNPELNYKVGMMYAQEQDNARAQQFLGNAVRLRPDYAEALDNLGVLFALTGRPSQAIAEFNQCIERAPGFDQAYLNLARVQIKLGRPAEAAATLRDLLRVRPGHPLAEKYLHALGQ